MPPVDPRRGGLTLQGLTTFASQSSIDRQPLISHLTRGIANLLYLLSIQPFSFPPLNLLYFGYLTCYNIIDSLFGKFHFIYIFYIFFKGRPTMIPKKELDKAVNIAKELGIGKLYLFGSSLYKSSAKAND